MKTIIAIAIIALTACGVSPEKEDVTTEALFGSSYGSFTDAATATQPWIQQVPLGTDRNAFLGFGIGDRFEFSSAMTFDLLEGSTYGTNGPTGDDFRLRVNSNPDPNSNNIVCLDLGVRGLLAASSYITGYIPVPIQPNPMPTGNFYAGQRGVALGNCHAVNGQWDLPISGMQIIFSGPYDASKPRRPPSAHGGGYKPANMTVRIDIDFPIVVNGIVAGGVTNRYFMPAFRIQGT